MLESVWRKGNPLVLLVGIEIDTATAEDSLVVVQSFICVQLFATPLDWSMPGFPILHHLLEFAQTDVHWVGDLSHLILYHPLLLLPLIFPSIRVFSNELALCIRWPKCWSFSFSISPFNEYSWLISLRIDWLDILAVQGTLESSPAPQFKSITSLVLSFLYSPTLTSIHDHWKNHSLDQTDLCWQSNVSAF